MNANRYEPRQLGAGIGGKWAVLDTVEGGYLDEVKPGTWSAAQTAAAAKNRETAGPATKPAKRRTGCARCELLEAALVAISGCATEEPVRRRAEAALAIVARTGGHANG